MKIKLMKQLVMMYMFGKPGENKKARYFKPGFII